MRCCKNDLVEVVGEIRLIRTREEIEAEHQDDIKRGRVMTDDGETILYSPYSFRKVMGLRLVVTNTRPAYKSHYRKPSHLREGVDLTTGRSYLFTKDDIVVNISDT